MKIPVRIGVAVGTIIALSIAEAIRGNYFSTSIIEEKAANEVVTILELNHNGKSLELK
jgi:DNA-binding transcriptional regulator LsrR (DeoR family)